jgi:hypothetical protein
VNEIRVSDEVLTDKPDLMSQLQARMIYGVIKRERALLASICGDYVAWMAYPPEPQDDPAEYAPYWVKMTEVLPAEACERIVAAWFEGQR